MAKITTGVLGVTTGKIGNIIAQRWKSINYIRQYTKPVDKKSESQLSYRARMTFLNTLSRPNLQGCISSGFSEYISGKDLSQVHAFFKFNLPIASLSASIEKLVISQGSIGDAAILTCTHNTLNNKKTITWDTSTDGSRLASDYIELWFKVPGSVVITKLEHAKTSRSAGVYIDSVGSEEWENGSCLYLIFRRTDNLISNNTGAICTPFVP